MNIAKELSDILTKVSHMHVIKYYFTQRIRTVHHIHPKTYTPNVAVLQKRRRIPLIKLDAVLLLSLLILQHQWRFFRALLELAVYNSLMEGNNRLPKATVSFH